VCLPDDFVYVSRSDGISGEAYVVALNPTSDEIIVEFPHITGADHHAIPRSQVSKHNGRPCHFYSQEVFEAGWVPY